MDWELLHRKLFKPETVKKEPAMIAKETLFLTADREKVVKEGDPKAQFLLVREGHELPDVTAEKYGVKGEKSSPSPAPGKASAADSPAPQNREDALPNLRKRGSKKSRK